MSALARYFLSERWQVSGSDLSPSAITDELKKEGARIFIGRHHSHIRANEPITKIIYTQAIPSSNIELRTAKRLGILCQSYPEAIGELTRKYKTIAVAGAHGKSTTTAMLSLILIEAGFDPTVIVGTKLKEFRTKSMAETSENLGTSEVSTECAMPTGRQGSASSGQKLNSGGNFYKGNSDWLVLEADEWRGAFWHYSPAVAVITNIDREHLDFYKNFVNVKKSFQKFISQIKPGGALILNKDYYSLIRTNESITNNKKVILYSLKQKGKTAVRSVLKIPGEHNVSNALAAYSIGRYLSIPRKTILCALGKYRGVWRRMEFRGNLKIMNSKLKRKNTKNIFHNSYFIIPVYDDYAHHPTEVKATLAAFKQKYPQNPLICVFQPHQEERLKLLYKSFLGAFKEADKVIILPIYKVVGRETRITNNELRIKDDLSEKLAKVIGATYIKNSEKDLMKAIQKAISLRHSNIDSHNSHYVLMMMGAGDINQLTERLIDKF